MGISPPGFSDAAPSPLAIGTFPAVDTFSLNGIPMAGKWTLLSADKEYEWQILKQWGFDYATARYIGAKLAVVKFKGEMWSPQDFFKFSQIRNTLLSKCSFVLGPLSMAMGIFHPELSAMGIDAVVNLVVRPVIQEEGGLWTTTIDFLQFRKTAPVVKTPDQSTPPVNSDVEGPPTKEQAEILKLTAELESQKAATVAALGHAL